MPVHAQVPTTLRKIRPIQQNVVRPQEPGATDDLDAQAQDGAGVDGARVRVARAEGGQGRAGAVEALLVVGALEGGLGEEGALGGGGDVVVGGGSAVGFGVLGVFGEDRES